jgi:hypothetical protein
MALSQLRLHQIVGKLRYYFVLEVFIYLFPDPVFFAALRPNTRTHAHAHTRAHAHAHARARPNNTIWPLHTTQLFITQLGWAPCSDTKSSSCTARLNYSKIQCRITLKTGVENRTVNDIAFHGFREFKGHLFLTQTYYCTSNLGYNKGSTSSDAVNPKNCEFLTEQWQSRPLSKSCSKLVTFHIFHITGYSVGRGCRPLLLRLAKHLLRFHNRRFMARTMDLTCKLRYTGLYVEYS